MEYKKKKIFNKIKPIFQEVLGNKKIKLKYDSSPDKIKNWDSTSTVEIIVGLERLLKIKFNVFLNSKIKH